MDIKKQLRREYKERAGRLSRDYINETNRAISDLLCSSEPFNNAKTIFIYISMSGEIATEDMIDSALSEGKIVCAPHVLSGGNMEARSITDRSELYPLEELPHIPGPAEESPLIFPESIDLVITPCLSCDPYGNRLGRGMGCYDRYLKAIRKDAVTIAVCRDRMLAMSLPRGVNDVPVHYCLTESGMIKCIR